MFQSSSQTKEKLKKAIFLKLAQILKECAIKNAFPTYPHCFASNCFNVYRVPSNISVHV